MSVSTKLLLYALIPQLVILAVWWAFRLAGNELEVWVSIAATVGVVVGQQLGMRAARLITRDIWGEDWQSDAAAGRAFREIAEARKAAPYN